MLILVYAICSYLSPGLTHPDGGVDPMVISMILSKEDFSLRDGALDPMDICMTLLKGVEIARFLTISSTSSLPLLIFIAKGSMHHDGVVDLMAICMILQKGAKFSYSKIFSI